MLAVGMLVKLMTKKGGPRSEGAKQLWLDLKQMLDRANSDHIVSEVSGVGCSFVSVVAFL